MCGQPLRPEQRGSTIDHAPEDITAPPARAADAETVPPAATVAAAGAGAVIEQTVGNYRLIRSLGGGGMGAVYEAVNQDSGQHVALKLVKSEFAASHETLERFRREGALASQLAHPRCVFVLAADEDRGHPYIVMELMTGATLTDLVKERGPLGVEEALRKILDVIDGLREAHQLGLVHRDVKPSNCFLEAGGRVKVGDFGLAKSLVGDVQLTRTGAFLGTPLFASPEQIKREAVDAQSDLYAVAATLYFLLTARAPFQTGEDMATMARIVSDDPPAMRSIRPELPKALDKVVLRGLARERKNRWRNLDEFRRALLAFLPAEPSIGGVGLRLGAYLLDTILLTLVGQVVVLPLILVTESIGLASLGTTALQALLYLGYFGVLEGLWGCSLGKRLLQLRVARPASTQPIGLGRASLRAGVLYLLHNLMSIVSLIVLVVAMPESLAPPADDTAQPAPALQIPLVLLVMQGMWFWIAIGLTVSTMRKRNGYRGLHEFLSDTRTYLLRRPVLRKRRVLATPKVPLNLEQPDGLPARVGPYRIRGALRWAAERKTLLGEDPNLDRDVWIWLRPMASPPLEDAQHSVGRTTRVRWLSCGTLTDQRWDAFLPPKGCLLADFVSENGRLSWSEFRPILEDLNDELQASCADSSLPRWLTLGQVWIGAAGQVQLLNAPLLDGDGDENQRLAGPLADDARRANDEQRALTFLGEIAFLALEGKPRPADAAAVSPRVPLPLHAARLLSRLPGLRPVPSESAAGTESIEHRMGAESAFDSCGVLQNELLATQAAPTEITSWARTKHVVGQGLFVYLGLNGVGLLVLAIMGIRSWMSGAPNGGANELVLIGLVIAVVLFFLPAYLVRGGLSFLPAGIVIVRGDGRRASRARCLARALLSWTFPAILVGVAVLAVNLRVPLLWATLPPSLAFIAYIALMIRNPRRAPHDYLLGTHLVPK